jgi:hypothetical protein
MQGDGEEVRALKVWIGTTWTFRKCSLWVAIRRWSDMRLR